MRSSENGKGRLYLMRKMKIVADSSANVLRMEGVSFASAPMKIITADREFVDDAALDVEAMVRYFEEYKGRSQTSCPNSSDWLEAFDDGEDIFCVTITSGLSGSYNAACAAKELYEAEHPGRRVYVIDSLSAGPELQLTVEKLREYMDEGYSYEEICHKISNYIKHTGLLFMLQSLKNFAANGRVSPAVAKIAGLLGIRIVGKASDKGQLEPMDKCRGEAKSLDAILGHLKQMGLSAGKVRIAHCNNPGAAQRMREMILSAFPKVDISISRCLGLCSYYAEQGGMLVGFEKM